MGFIWSFTVLFYRSNEFDNIWKIVCRISVMLIGELEYTSLFSDVDNRLPITSDIVFLVFLGLGNIVFMNVLFGSAISNIQVTNDIIVCKREH